MAFSSATEWDCRTTGDDSNGGGFQVGAAGTDYSQQDSPQITYTDMAIGATTTQFTSVAHSPTSDIVGNIINVTSGTGFTVQRVQVLSVAGGIATCDKSLGTAASTGGNGKLGGALATLGAANALVVAQNTVWFKSGTYTLTASHTISVSSRWIGFNTTHGDGGTHPIVTTSTNSIDGLIQCSGATTDIELNNFTLSTTASTRGTGIQNVNNHNTTNPPYFLNLTIDGFTEAINGDNAGSHFDWSFVYVGNCLIKNSTGTTGKAQIRLNGGALWIADSLICDGAGAGVLSIGTLLASRTVFARNTVGAAVSGNGIQIVRNCVFADNSSDGLQPSSSSSPVNATCILENNIFYGNGGWGADGGASVYSITLQADAGRTNAFGSNASGNRNTVQACPGDISLSADPFTASASNDFSLNSTAGGGAACKAAGFPGICPAGTGSLDIGAIQSGGGGGGGGAALSRVFSGY